MKTTALRLYGKRDLRLETFDLPEMQEDEILATVVTDSLCLSSWKEANLGENHKKVPDDVATNPIIIGHEFCGDILAVGKKWQHKFQPGKRSASGNPVFVISLSACAIRDIVSHVSKWLNSQW